MGWIGWILLALRYGPAIVGIVTEIIELIRRMRDVHGNTDEARFAEQRLRAAMEDYRKRRDRRRLRQLRDDLQRYCGYDAAPERKA